MDPAKTGRWIAALRHEAGLTQQVLGEKLGVTNKTISRWENGNYMPDIAMLQQLSNIFDVSINELLSGQRLNEREYPIKAEQNLAEILQDSRFSIGERRAFWKHRWLRAHTALLIFLSTAALGLWIWSVLTQHFRLYTVLPFVYLCLYIYLHNRMMGYIEAKIYDRG